MTRRQFTPTDVALVAIDISKARNDVLIEVAHKKRRRRLIVPNTRSEHDRVVALLNELECPVIAGFEAPRVRLPQFRELSPTRQNALRVMQTPMETKPTN